MLAARAVAATLFAGVLLSVCFLPVARAEKLEDLKPQGYVNDFAAVLDSATKAQLTNLCDEVDKKTHAQIAVVTIRSLDGNDIDDYANRLYQKWGIGSKPENRGVLVLMAVSDHRYRTEVGYGLEPILPDGKVGGYWRDVIPTLRQGNYNSALLEVTADVAAVIARDRGVTLSAAPARAAHNARSAPQLDFGNLIFWAIFGFLGLTYLLRLFVLPSARGVRRGGWWGGPWIGGGFFTGGGGSWGGGSFGGGGGFGGFGGGISGGGGASGGW